MIQKKVTRFYAECGRGFWKKAPALFHEGSCKCWTNPKNKTCRTCSFGNFDPGSSLEGIPSCWLCSHDLFSGDHSGAPEGFDHLSVNCRLWKPKKQTACHDGEQ